uniref:Protein kinase domain-containing protein n=1 Tax=Plectus sambesii TaxID=2011161 RepID=A0A914V2P4_9BILA
MSSSLYYIFLVLVLDLMNVLAGGKQKNDWSNSNAPNRPPPPAPPPPGPPPPQFAGRDPPPAFNALNMAPPWATGPPRPPGFTGNCTICPEYTYFAVFVFSSRMTDLDFESVKNTWKEVVEECKSEMVNIKVGYMGPKGPSANGTWLYREDTFQAMLKSLKLADFRVNTSFTNQQFNTLLLKTIDSAKLESVRTPSPPSSLGKEFLIVTDLDLALDMADANAIVSELRKNNFHVQYLWLPTSNKKSPVNMYINNIDRIVDPQVSPIYLNSLADLTAADTFMKLTFCRFDHSMLMLDKNYLQPMPEPEPFIEGYDYGRPRPPPPQGPPPQGPPPPQSSNVNWGLIAAIAGGVIALVVIVGVMCVIYSHTKFKWKANIEQIRAVARSGAVPNQYYELERRDEWTIPKGHLEIKYDQKLGAGAFCDVFKGRLSGQAPVCKIYPSIQASRSYANCDVAVKMLPTFADDMARSDFIQEITFMKSLSYHPHLICMLGVAWEGLNEPRLVTEYCINGDLLHYIRDKKEEIMLGYSNITGLKLKDLVSFAWQISDGLDYLHSKGCIHRDVAARNILVDYTNTAKIADFGLCRLTERALYTSRGGRLPIKWMALESLKSYEYSFKSDVWSYGVLLFELFSLGEVPFACHQPAEMLLHLEAGNRLKQPSFCPNEIYKIMFQSWLNEPRDRPSFEMIRSEIAKVLENATANYGYLQVEADYVEQINNQEGVDDSVIDPSLYTVSNAANFLPAEASPNTVI